jgi:hypothetical protein
MSEYIEYQGEQYRIVSTVEEYRTIEGMDKDDFGENDETDEDEHTYVATIDFGPGTFDYWALNVIRGEQVAISAHAIRDTLTQVRQDGLDNIVAVAMEDMTVGYGPEEVARLVADLCGSTWGYEETLEALNQALERKQDLDDLRTAVFLHSPYAKRHPEVIERILKHNPRFLIARPVIREDEVHGE